MNIRRSFFIALPLGMLLTAVIYFGLFFLQLGVPTSQWAWLHEVIEVKRRAAAAITKPKLLIVAGSSALYGINAEEIEKQTGMPTVNFGTNAALGPAYLLHLTRKVCRPGDTVLLAFEYEPYLFGDITGATADELFIHYVLGYDREYVRGLGFSREIKLALLTPGERLWDGVLAVFRKPKPNAATEETTRQVLSDISSHGDQTGALPEKRTATFPTRTIVSYPLAYGLPDSPAGFPPIREFCEWARARNITVLATFPNICHRPEYDLPAAAKAPQQLREFYTSLGVPVLGEATGAMLPEEKIFDSFYHPMHGPALERTRALLVQLAPFLNPRPGGTR
jgi:hypothetical protein